VALNVLSRLRVVGSIYIHDLAMSKDFELLLRDPLLILRKENNVTLDLKAESKLQALSDNSIIGSASETFDNLSLNEYIL
jgi:hypothetical protein